MSVPADADPQAQAAAEKQFHVRFYEPRDRAAVRRICADTGFLSNPIDPLFEDRELFADYLTRYYTDYEPESTLVCELDGEILGYLNGCRRSKAYTFFRLWNNLVLFAVGMGRYFFRPYGEATRQYIRWLLTKAGAESPHTPQGLAHFHINLLPKARGIAQVRALIDQFLGYLVEHGEKGVYGQVVTFDTRRGPRMFERFGFRVVDQREVTKYKDRHEGGVFLFTIIKDLSVHARLYGNDLAKAGKPKPADEA
jgi:ribosomal protein S18 acetylase RimI-like enzyme